MNALAHAVRANGNRAARRRASGSDLAFAGICALLFAASVAATLAQSLSMSAMGELPMPGGWSMSMMWMPTCGRTWARVAASFAVMWIVMMAAMMLPSLAQMLARYRAAVGSQVHASRLALLTLRVAIGYWVVWIASGVGVFALGAALATLELRWQTLAHAVPLAAGLVVLLAGALQFSAWKARHLACWRATPYVAADAATAWRHGMRIGIHCGCCCAGLTAMLLVVGMMDLRMMAVVTAAITAERLFPDGARIARAVGAAAIAGGLVLIAQALAAG
jgi:predicted metal-binding membrane protein